MTSRWKRFTLTTIVTALILAPLSLAGPQSNEDQKKSDKPVESPFGKATKSKSTSGKTRVYTNKDLSRHALDSDDSSTPAETPAASRKADEASPAKPARLDPLAQIQEDKRRAAERQTNLAAARQKLEQARKTLVDLEKRIAAVKNPFLARPAAPEKNPEEWKKMNASERVDRSEKELQAAREAVTQAELELESAQRGQ